MPHVLPYVVDQVGVILILAAAIEETRMEVKLSGFNLKVWVSEVFRG